MYIFCNLYNISSKTIVLADKLQEEALKKKSRFRQDLHYSKYFKNENVLRTSLKDTYRNGKFREGCSQSRPTQGITRLTMIPICAHLHLTCVFDRAS